MTCVIVPNILRDKINALIDEMQQGNPAVNLFRESLYQDFLKFYYEEGYLPSAADVEFSVGDIAESFGVTEA